jgi:predicted acylesterase/phospholipase RssA
MQYDLVFEGGGAKGMVLVGAYEVFVERGNTPGRLLGTSAGAITAALIAAGYTPQEMLAALSEKENGQAVFAGFLGEPALFEEAALHTGALRAFLAGLDFKFIPNIVEDRLKDQLVQALAQNPRTRHLVAFVERGGWYAADRFVNWLQNKLDSGQRNGQARRFSGLTLQQFFDATGVALSVVASDTTAARLLVLNHQTAPACPLVWAVRMSMGIPLLWDEVVWRAEWGPYLGRVMSGHTVVDGGVLSNFPIELLISDRPQVTALMGPKQNTPVLGMLIDDTLAVPTPRGLLLDVKIKPEELRTVQRIRALIDTAITAHDKMVIEAFEQLVVRLPAAGYGVTEFEMSDDRRAALVDGGRAAMRAYLDRPPLAAAVPRGEEDVVAQQAQQHADRIASDLLS